MQIETEILIEELLAIIEKAVNSAKRFKALNSVQLNLKKTASDWSILECIEHLNLYGDFYLPEIEKQLLLYKNVPASSVFKSGAIGNYFANLMKGKNGAIKKMKSPKDKNPCNSILTVEVIDRFLEQQEILKSLLIQARAADLNKIKIPISLTKFIQLRLGDSFRFFVYHIERHIMQAERLIKE